MLYLQYLNKNVKGHIIDEFLIKNESLKTGKTKFYLKEFISILKNFYKNGTFFVPIGYNRGTTVEVESVLFLARPSDFIL